jgi:hypothetical protein
LWEEARHTSATRKRQERKRINIRMRYPQKVQ